MRRTELIGEDKQDDDAPASNDGDELLRQALSEIEPLPDPMEDMERERDQFRALAQRAQADLVNYRRRVGEERQELQRNANSSLILKFLSVVDDFERAIALLPEDAAGWQEGLMLVKRNLDNLLESEGVSKIEAAGKPFDPWEHEAVHYLETPDADDGTIIEVFRDGYRLHDRVLRASQVIVAKAPAVAQADSDSPPNS
jgi:molecular chaperone GrpE